VSITECVFLPMAEASIVAMENSPWWEDG
jgi:hypothetical protein